MHSLKPGQEDTYTISRHNNIRVKVRFKIKEMKCIIYIARVYIRCPSKATGVWQLPRYQEPETKADKEF